MKKKYFAFAIILLLIIGFVGCIGGNTDIKSRFVGTWEMEDISQDESSTIRILWTFRENNTASMTSIYLFKDQDREPETYMSSGTYNVSKGELNLTSKNSNGETVNTFFEYIFTNDYNSLSLYRNGNLAFEFNKKNE